MSAPQGIFSRLFAAFALFAAGLALATGAAGWFFADSLSLEVLAGRAEGVLATLIEAEKQARSGREARIETGELISALDFTFLVGKQIPGEWSALADGLHTLADGRFVIMRRQDGVSYALCGPLAPKALILGRIGSMFLFCGLIGLVAALALALFLSERLARPLRLLARSLAGARPGRDAPLPPASVERGDEIGALARAITAYQESVASALEREKFFTAAASHELRTPLTVLSQGLELLEAQLPAGDAAAILERLTRTSSAMTMTVAALLCLARAQEQELEELDIKALFFRVLEDFALPGAPGGEAGGVMLRGGITARIRGAPANAPGQAQLAAAVFRNLLENAILHGGGGDIFIDAAGDAMRIRNRAASEEGARSGFGLMIARRACERMGWRLARSDEGGETIFTVYFSGSGNER